MAVATHIFAQNPDVKRIPNWQRTALIDDNGVVYLTHAIAGLGRDTAMFICACDGVPFRILKNRIYLPAQWLRQEYPNIENAVDELCGKVLASENKHRMVEGKPKFTDENRTIPYQHQKASGGT